MIRNHPDICPPIHMADEHERVLVSAVGKSHEEISQAVATVRDDLTRRGALVSWGENDDESILILHAAWVYSGCHVYEVDGETSKTLVSRRWTIEELPDSVIGTTYVVRTKDPPIENMLGYYITFIGWGIAVIPFFRSPENHTAMGDTFTMRIKSSLMPEYARPEGDDPGYDSDSDVDRHGDAIQDEDSKLLWRLVYGLALALINRTYKEKLVYADKGRRLAGRKTGACRYSYLKLVPETPETVGTRIVSNQASTEGDPHPHGTPCLHVCHEHKAIRWMREPEGEVEQFSYDDHGPLFGVKRAVRAHLRGRGEGERVTRVGL